MIDLVARPGQASWEVEGLARHTPDLKLDCFVDTTDRTAFFSLRGQCTLKTGTPAHVSLFLFIYPEDIQSLEVSYTSSPLPHTEEQEAVPDMDRFIRLRFIMTQPPSLVAPKHRPLQPKHRSEALFDALQSLATVKDISFYLDPSSLPIEIQAQLVCLPSIFSSANIHSRPRTHVNRASLVRLYGGAGGQIVNPRTTASEATHQETDEAGPTNSTHAASGVLQDAAQTSTATQTRKRSASASGFLPPYLNRHDERDIASSSNHRFESAQENASPSQESTQFSLTPDRNGKRPRLATPSDLDLPSLPPTPTAADFLEASTDPSKFYTIRQQFLTRIAALETRNEQLLTRNVALEARVEHSSKLEDWFRLEVRQRVGGEVTRQLDKLHQKTGRKWEEEIRQEVRDQITEDVKEELYEDATKQVLRRMATVLVEAVDGSGWLVPGSTACENLLSRSVVPGENALYAAVADVQKTHAEEMSEEEMARVMDYLEQNPLSAVKYNACGETMRRYFVGQWKADTRRRRSWGMARW
ncbi:hypothetical protein GE21DRAFT_3809 [Neurospora crassa]|uniref:Uncharacterized protein n=1 Tax=Neurospora crassa (strain ATCC 24698 / 74-OR23-1A / CBS 708.71 / DSM 1257 / FGSC 987) TaxID=367110 RepID=Q7S0Z2_NEUCR|nr:hypothetical protein NCU09152 [Neurospora crassa OR74A]EAA29008.2 hypothetical protein NCU09152 [Neurospora crassa OR74A]KHE84371.1 hypothetical protein GE21DRAFT_3809 [Neurospora crassa]|eukprot:XP_958244.2 hypothetical protein NCU09152 [Neurospora crassa OR74A]